MDDRILFYAVSCWKPGMLLEAAEAELATELELVTWDPFAPPP